MLVEFQDGYNTRRWGGLYTNAKHQGKWAYKSNRSRVHTNLATAGLGRELSAWVTALSVIFLHYKRIIICVIDMLLAYQPISAGIYV